MTAARFYIPRLDGLRFLAFLAVFVAHTEHSPVSPRLATIVPAGGFGVDLFFVLSSFLITTLLLREQATQGRIDVPAFWMRRVLRIGRFIFSSYGRSVHSSTQRGTTSSPPRFFSVTGR